MSERALRGDFGIRCQDTALPNPGPHRHEYFQIHVQLKGTTRHLLNGTSRAVVPGTVCFILPFKPHFIPTVPDSQHYILNASLNYLLPSLDIDILDLEDIPIERAPNWFHSVFRSISILYLTIPILLSPKSCARR
jgi:hypothetical protein